MAWQGVQDALGVNTISEATTSSVYSQDGHSQAGQESQRRSSSSAHDGFYKSTSSNQSTQSFVEPRLTHDFLEQTRNLGLGTPTPPPSGSPIPRDTVLSKPEYSMAPPPVRRCQNAADYSTLPIPVTIPPHGITTNLMTPRRLQIPHYLRSSRLQLVPTKYLMDKDKAKGVFYLSLSPFSPPSSSSFTSFPLPSSSTSQLVLSKHGKDLIKIWSVATGALQGTIKYTSYVNAQIRSREFFVRSHAVVSEFATLAAVSASFGSSLEIWNWSKRKKAQTIDNASRWACARVDAFYTRGPSLSIYREKEESIFLFRVAGASDAESVSSAGSYGRKPYIESGRINLRDIKTLPFVPKYPELAISHDTLVAVAGPRPGDPPRSQAAILLAWQISEDSKLCRWLVPIHPEIQRCLPIAVAVEGGTTCVSIWIPPNHYEVSVTGGKYRRVPVHAANRYVLFWDILSNATRMYLIPNTLAVVSPDCRFVAYCDPATQRFAILEATTGDELWRWPDPAGRLEGLAGYSQFENLDHVMDFQFEGNLLVVGDSVGAVGVYEIREGRAGAGSQHSRDVVSIVPSAGISYMGKPSAIIGELES
jgi:hypothetical protein